MKPIERSAWGARYGRGDPDPGPEPRVVIHHSYRPALTPKASMAEEFAAMRGIELYHVKNNGWAGIGYNFAVAPSGRVYEGRGFEYKGAHAGPVNASSIGVCLLIDGNVTPPSDTMIEAVQTLIRMGLEEDHIAADYVLSGHRDHMPRECPGDKVYARLQEFRHDSALMTFLPELAIPAKPDRPLTSDRMRLDKIEIPRRQHVDEIIRVRELPAEVAAVGISVAEVLLRAVLRGEKVPVDLGLKMAADALADWLKARAA